MAVSITATDRPQLLSETNRLATNELLQTVMAIMDVPKGGGADGVHAPPLAVVGPTSSEA